MKPSGARYDIADLKEIMARLRDPEGGCPWDLKQSFESIAPYTLEEAYEVVDALEKGDMGALVDELGDLLFQVIYHAQLAHEQQAFEFDDVVQAISEKMVRRHPHVFGDEALTSDEEIAEMWARVKGEEKQADLPAGVPSSLLDDVPVGLPGLTRAVKLQKKAAKVGFDWPDVGPVLDKIKEELSEFEAELGRDGLDGQRAREEEFGDLLFVLANLGRHLKIDPEAALRRANGKFIQRFQYIERELTREGKALSEYSLEEMDAKWDEAKALEPFRSE